MDNENWIHFWTRASPIQLKINKHLVKSKILKNSRRYEPDFQAKLYYNKKIVASCKIFLDTRNNFYLSCFGTDPHYRRKGLGKILLGKIIKFAKRKNINKIQLTCTRQSKRLYMKFGFVPTSRHEVTSMSLDLK